MGYVTIKATCWSCGDVSTTSDQVTLRILEGSAGEVGQYRFKCPKCNKIVLKDASSYVISVLTTNGIKTEFYEESVEILERPMDDVPPISLDDLIDLDAWLRSLESE